jgi:spore maturation protein CgeB
MKFLVVDMDYVQFIRQLYATKPGLETLSYDEQYRARMDTCFSYADFYSTNLRKLGHEAWNIIANIEPMQKRWGSEHGLEFEDGIKLNEWYRNILQWGIRTGSKTPLRRLRSLVSPLVESVDDRPAWFYQVLSAQVKHYQPDVLVNLAMAGMSLLFLRELKPYTRLIVGQHAATPLRPSGDYRYYNLIISSFLPTVDWCRRKGIAAELLRLGFEPRILQRLESGRPKHDLTFVGSFSQVHLSRIVFMENLCTQFEQFKVWGPGTDGLPPDSPLFGHYVGQAWGLDMYQVLHDSKVTINHHGDVLPYANNLRLFEATGAGAMLLTGWKENLPELFEPGREVVTHRDVQECIEKAHYYLEHDDEREAIARAGQQRTLREHTWYQRMQELVDIVSKYI